MRVGVGGLYLYKRPITTRDEREVLPLLSRWSRRDQQEAGKADFLPRADSDPRAVSYTHLTLPTKA